MEDLIKKIVDCVIHGRTIASYPFGYAVTLGPSEPPDLIQEAKECLANDGLVRPPFDFSSVEFRFRDGH